jgi:HD-GYP domain-containing protein (c-di-GMP phosphodiesterase class II)/DNA-binding CsgD family transcriptional regulator
VIRLADLLAGLSRLADLGFGYTQGQALWSGALAARFGQTLGIDDEDVRAAMYAALLLHLGCVGYAHETARLYGDEVAMGAAVSRTNVADLRSITTTFVPALLAGRPLREKARLVGVVLARGQRHGHAYSTASCEVGRDAARRLGLPEPAQASVYHSHEWWDGGGPPTGLAGDAIPLGARIAAVASIAATFAMSDGSQAAAEAVGAQAGTALDPDLADRFADTCPDLVAELRTDDPRHVLLAAEPRPVVTVLEPHLPDVARVFGEIADLKSPWTHGHSRGVAMLARDAGQRLGLPASEIRDLEVAGHLHDVGRVAITSSIWDKPAALSDHEWEQVRLHAYHAERILSGSEQLASLASLVGAHHERCDGSGYHRGADSLPMAACILAAADTYQAMTQSRPHRQARPPDQAGEELRAGARAGHLDADAVSAVLAAAGHDAPVTIPEPPAGLTPREVEVLALVAHGCSNKQIGVRLGISRRTAEQHVQNVYRKIGVSSRAAAALFAMEHDLLDTGRP